MGPVLLSQPGSNDNIWSRLRDIADDGKQTGSSSELSSDPASAGCSGPESDSSPPSSSLPPPSSSDPTNSDYPMMSISAITCSTTSDYSMLGARPKHSSSSVEKRDLPRHGATKSMDLLDRLSPMVHLSVRNNAKTESGSCGGSDAGYHSLAPGVVGSDAGFHSLAPAVDGGYHSLAPSRSPTTSCSTSSLETSSLGGPVSHPNVWNIRATSSFSPVLCLRQRKLPRSVTPTKPRSRRCHLASLPDDVILTILSFLSSVDIVRTCRTCKRLYFLAWERELWTSLVINNPEIETDRAIKSILEVISRNGGLASIQRIDLGNSSRLTDRGLAILARRCPGLTQLEIQHCHAVTNGGLLDLVSRCQMLDHLDVTGCPMVTAITMPLLPGRFSRHAPRPTLGLTYLDISDCPSVDDTSVKMVVENCPRLHYLFLRRCYNVSDVGVKWIASYCLMLKELSVSDCVKITDFGMFELAKLGPNLKYLSIAKCEKVTDSGVKQLARHCYKLRYLNARGCENISDSAVESLARSCSRLRSLDIGKCDVTDGGLKLLSEHCPNLKKLSVRGCEMVSDAGIQCIAYYCRGLQQLNIQDVTGVSVEGYRTVKRYCRRCIIEHTNPGLC